MLDDGRIVRLFLAYLAKSKVQISRAAAERPMFAKLDNPRFMTDTRPLLPVDIALRLTDQVIMEHLAQVFRRLVSLIPREPWAEVKERLRRHEFPSFS